MASRHSKPNRCPNCRAAKFFVRAGFTKPDFICANGCSTWQSGYSGEPYLKNAMNYLPSQTARDYVTHYWTNDGELVENVQ